MPHPRGPLSHRYSVQHGAKRGETLRKGSSLSLQSLLFLLALTACSTSPVAETTTTTSTTTAATSVPATMQPDPSAIILDAVICLDPADEECKVEQAHEILINRAAQLGFVVSEPQARRMMQDACEVAYLALGNEDTWRAENSLLTDDELQLLGAATLLARDYEQCETDDELAAVRFLVEQIMPDA